jgi:molybdate transport system substrate-binding protein
MNHFLLFIGVLFLLVGCESSATLKVATSANMKFAMEEIVAAYQEEHDIEIDLIVSSSGKLNAQIEQGAPFDLFVAANTKYPNSLFKKGLTVAEPKVYAHGSLAMWTLNQIGLSYETLVSDRIEKIAIANPKTAPYGEATIKVLKNEGIYQDIEHKLVYAESISQCNQFITSRTVDVGFTALSSVYLGEFDKIERWIPINPDSHDPIEQAAVVLKNTEQEEDALDFYNYLFTDKSQDILKKYGYLIPENE